MQLLSSLSSSDLTIYTTSAYFQNNGFSSTQFYLNISTPFFLRASFNTPLK